MKRLILCTLGLFIAVEVAWAQSSASEAHLREDIPYTGKLLLKSSYTQFTKPHTWAIASAGILTVWLVSNNDKKLLRQWGGKRPSDVVDFLGDHVALTLNLPLIPLGLYELARYRHSDKLYNFALEYTATLYLTLAETLIISSIPFHKRPDNSNLTWAEKSFRLRSSFPSGHMAGVSSLFFKTLQYYGPLTALAPFTLTVVTAMQRMQARRHWPSDVIGTFFLAWLASEGTRLVHQRPEHYHRLYRWIYQHQLTIMPQWRPGQTGLNLSLSF